jgi:hypothetical protein
MHADLRNIRVEHSAEPVEAAAAADAMQTPKMTEPAIFAVPAAVPPRISSALLGFEHNPHFASIAARAHSQKNELVSASHGTEIPDGSNAAMESSAAKFPQHLYAAVNAPSATHMPILDAATTSPAQSAVQPSGDSGLGENTNTLGVHPEVAERLESATCYSSKAPSTMNASQHAEKASSDAEKATAFSMSAAAGSAALLEAPDALRSATSQPQTSSEAVGSAQEAHYVVPCKTVSSSAGGVTPGVIPGLTYCDSSSSEVGGARTAVEEQSSADATDLFLSAHSLPGRSDRSSADATDLFHTAHSLPGRSDRVAPFSQSDDIFGTAYSYRRTSQDSEEGNVYIPPPGITACMRHGAGGESVQLVSNALFQSTDRDHTDSKPDHMASHAITAARSPLCPHPNHIDAVGEAHSSTRAESSSIASSTDASRGQIDGRVVRFRELFGVLKARRAVLEAEVEAAGGSQDSRMRTDMYTTQTDSGTSQNLPRRNSDSEELLSARSSALRDYRLPPVSPVHALLSPRCSTSISLSSRNNGSFPMHSKGCVIAHIHLRCSEIQRVS